jgi:hypothetical protein
MLDGLHARVKRATVNSHLDLRPEPDGNQTVLTHRLSATAGVWRRSGPSWWAHLEFTGINIELTILTLHVFLRVLERRANPSSVRPSPDVAETLELSLGVSAVVGAVVAHFIHYYGVDRY